MTSTLFSYFRIYCVTENLWRYVFDVVPPTFCPFNPLHQINPDSVSDIGEKKTKQIGFLDSPYVLEGFFLRVDTTEGPVEILFPSATESKKARIYIQRIAGKNPVNLIPSAGDTFRDSGGSLVDKSTIKVLSTSQLYKAVCDGTQWIETPLEKNDGLHLIDPYLPASKSSGI